MSQIRNKIITDLLDPDHYDDYVAWGIRVQKDNHSFFLIQDPQLLQMLFIITFSFMKNSYSLYNTWSKVSIMSL